MEHFSWLWALKNTLAVESKDVVISTDYEHAMQEHSKDVNKESDFISKARGAVKALRQEQKAIKFDVTIEYSSAIENF